MKRRRRRLLLFVTVCTAMVIGYSFMKSGESATIPAKQAAAEDTAAEIGGEVTGKIESGPKDEPSDGAGQAVQTEDGIAVIAQPADIAVLVNKQNKLPENYNPADLVYPDVRFIFSEKVEKRKMRQEAATALKQMFKAAEDDGILLAGVSAYRSHSTQKALFDRYTKRDGLIKARTYSAVPGTSEHETGLAIDVSGSEGKCAATDCFADTMEALWLEEHAYEFGFIIRYLKGKEEITGYQYEPWHLRYVGKDLAAELAESGETLEEYFDAVPVAK